MHRWPLIVAAMLSSLWLTPVLLFVGMKAGMTGLCYLQGCVRIYNAGESPDKSFRVLVIDAKHERFEAIPYDALAMHFRKNPQAMIAVPALNGTSNNDFAFTVTPVEGTLRTIAMHNSDSPRMEFAYSTDGEAINPIRSMVMGVGYVFGGLPLGIALAWLVRRAGLIWLRRLKAAARTK